MLSLLLIVASRNIAICVVFGLNALLRLLTDKGVLRFAATLPVLSASVLLLTLIKEQALGLFAIFDQACHVSSHLLNLAKKTMEVELHCAEEVSHRGLNLLHLLLNADDTLLELLADIGRAAVVLASGHQDLLSLDVTDLLRLELDVVVGGALVDYLDMTELVAHDLILDRGGVAMLGLILDVTIDLRILGEHLAHQELLGEGECIDVGLSDVDEFSLRVAAEIVVTKEGVSANLVS